MTPVNPVTHGPLTSGLLRFAAPLSLAMGTNAVHVTVDMFWVGQLGVAPVAGVLSASILTMLSFALQLGAQTGATAFIARAYGAGDLEQARRSARQALQLSFALGLLVAALYVPLGEWLLGVALRQSPEVAAHGARYLTPIALLMPVSFVQSQIATVLQAIGESRKTTLIFLTATLVNMVLDPILIKGWLGPPLGVTGAAWATNIGRGCGLLVGLWLLQRSSGATRELRLRLRPAWPTRDLIAMVQIGAPRFVQFSFVPISKILLIGLATSVVAFSDRDAVSAAFNICMRLELILLLPIFGLSRAAQVYVGQNLGAANYERARRSGWVAAALSMLYLSLASLLYGLNTEAMVRPFVSASGGEPRLQLDQPSSSTSASRVSTPQAERVLQLSTGYVRVIVWPLALWGVALVLNATLNGAGDTLLPALFTGFMLIPGRYGLALLLAPRYGLDGIWWSVAITMAGSGLGFLFYYSRNRWIRVAERKLGAAQLERPARSPPLSSEPT